MAHVEGSGTAATARGCRRSRRCHPGAGKVEVVVSGLKERRAPKP